MLGVSIADRLVEAGLIQADRREKLARAIADGAMKSEDWRVLLEGPTEGYGTEQTR